MPGKYGIDISPEDRPTDRTAFDMTVDGRPPRVLVTGAGGQPAISFVRSLGEDACSWFMADTDRHAAGLHLARAGRRFAIPPGEAAEFVPTLARLCRRHHIDILVPTLDCQLIPLAEARAQFEEHGVRLLLPHLDPLRICLDKWRLAQRCAGLVAVPRTYLLDEHFDPEAVLWPAIVKPRRGSGSRGIVRANNFQALIGQPGDGSLLVQELLPGLEYSVDVLRRLDGVVVAAVPRLRERVDSGITVAGRTVHDQELQQLATAVVTELDLTGIINVQVRCDLHGRPTLMEVNPRPPGTLALTVVSGVHMPAWVLTDLLGHPVPDHLEFKDLAMVRYWQEAYFDPAEAVAQ